MVVERRARPRPATRDQMAAGRPSWIKVSFHDGPNFRAVRELMRGLALHTVCAGAGVPDCAVEVLIPDFQSNWSAVRTVMEAHPDVLNHNIETVRRLHATVRPKCGYDNSLELLRRAREYGARVTKSGLMVGLGESLDE